MQMRKFRLPLMEAIEACAAVLPHCSKDHAIPVITAAHISGDAIRATDRYSVGQFTLSRSLKEGSILLPGAAVAWLARFVVKNLVDYSARSPECLNPDNEESYHVVIEAPEPATEPGTKYTDAEAAERKEVLVTVQVVGRRGIEQQRQFRAILGHFPSVGRLIEQYKPATDVAPVNLGPDLVEKFTGYAKKWHRGKPLRFTLSQVKSDGKPGPVLISIGRFTGLLQPNLNT